jgi:cyclic beta-1,2-glucan synthetase
LFSTEQMAQHGKVLAAAHELSHSPAPDNLLKRLDDNEMELARTCAALTAAIGAKLRITPAGEWLVDNFPLVQEQIRMARRHLPKGYSREIPRLANGPSLGLPRVYDLALEAIAHGDGRIDEESLFGFVTAYQTIAPLTLGEAWAIPIMLRLALIENLRRVGLRIQSDRVARNHADDWANRMLGMVASDPKSLILVIADMARSDPSLTSPFVAELARRLQGHGPSLALALTWIEQRLTESGLTIAQLIWSENQQQATDQVSVSNTIGSLRLLGTMDWHAFVERVSLVERILLEDACTDLGSYREMDFATRDRYRHVVARLARRSRCSEIEVARTAIHLAQRRSAQRHGGAHTTHVGYYLIDRGRRDLEEAVGYRRALVQRMREALGPFALTLHIGAILSITMLCTAGVMLTAAAGENHLRSVLMAGAALLAFSQLASSLVNWMSTLWAVPQRLPRMDYSKGLPESLRTLVVVPTILASDRNVADLLEALEVRFLGNRDAALSFALLTDFKDAPTEIHEHDAPLLRQASAGIERLNRKYRSSAGGGFLLLHRPRSWNASDRIWMGRERKRGKLADLNAALRSGEFERFSMVVGDVEALGSVRYVITLDSDTQLPRESARQMVGAMAHPLNRPLIDGASGCVRSGYGILQPRIASSVSGRSRYALMFGGGSGIDPYTRSASDVYQDVFDEGSFTGKGIYDVEAFERALHGRLPDNRILSHDLLEGCYARSGLLSDVHLYEEYPSRYATDVNRQRRWIRGDWQIANWIFPWTPGAGAHRQRNPLSALSRWKIFDNLRRSLVAPALLALLFVGWSGSLRPWAWELAVIGAVLFPPALMGLVDAVRKSSEMRWRRHLATVSHSIAINVGQAGFRIACLPYESAVHLGALLASTWRTLLTRRRLLEWTLASSVVSPVGCVGSYRSMWVAPFAAILAAALIATQGTEGVWFSALPLLLLWVAAPAIAWWVSRPLAPRDETLNPEQHSYLRRVARRTWAFFERFVTAEDHWLPPDNFQEHPAPVIAHRTSPTNIGMSLLANLAAYDFGFVPVGGLIERTANTFATLERLPRHRGHFLNWYDTRTLQPLLPRYVSSVDSGNLAGHLLTLRGGLDELADQPVVSPRVFEGLLDTVELLERSVPADQVPYPVALRAAIEAACAERPSSLQSAFDHLRRIAECAPAMEDRRAEAEDERQAWANALARQCHDAASDMEGLAPWLRLAAAPGKCGRFVEFVGIPSLRELACQADGHCRDIEERLPHSETAEERAWLSQAMETLSAGSARAKECLAQIETLSQQAGFLADMEYGFLYDENRHLLAIGYNVDDSRRDASYYDLLASEARLCTFTAIAQGQLPQQSWFSLGRSLTSVGGDQVLLSWSGSMFEYLMPLLVMPSYEGTLLAQTCRAAVDRQIVYGKQIDAPWGVSESGYAAVDAASNYQYRAFGVPGLGLQRSSADDRVVAPYASMLALMVAPRAACANLQRLGAAGLEGRFGFYEAIDYSLSRLPPGQSSVVVRSFMAHHQGMSLLALAHHLLGRPMQRRFTAVPLLQAALPLLQEKIPNTATFHVGYGAEGGTLFGTTETLAPSTIPAQTPAPEVQLMSNGRYHVMVTNAGGGYSRWKDVAVTRWREDATRDHWGSFLYLRDVATGEVWSASHQPTLRKADTYEVLYSEGRAEFRRRDRDIETITEIFISPEDDVELRRMRLTNHAQARRTIEITSYSEVVLAPDAADAMQPSFGNLFVQTELLKDRRAILCTRRTRSADEPARWMFHLLAPHGTNVSAISYETDRMRFIGRGRSLVAPLALSAPGDLSGTQGSVLDPIVAIRCRVTLDPGQSASLDWISGAAASSEACRELVDRYQDRHLADRAIDLAWTHGGVALRQLNATEADAQSYRRLASSVLHVNAALRADSAVLMQNRRGQSGLWSYAISGDLPIVLLKVTNLAHLDLARRMIQCHAYWRLKGLAVDLVIWNEDHAGYRQLLQDQIMGLIDQGPRAHAVDRPGGIFLRSSDQISGEDRILLQSVARVIIADASGTLSEQINRRGIANPRMARLITTRAPRTEPRVPLDPDPRGLVLDNGTGGFSADGSEYVITTSRARRTPMPWVNVLANADFGTVVSESGLGYTWRDNAHEFRLSPWSDDAVGTAGGEALYLRDEETGSFWSPAPLPCGDDQPYRTRHGFGYSVFEHTANGIVSELWIYVDIKDAVKFSVLKVRNESGRKRRLSATGYVEWVLGDLRPKTAMHIVTGIDPASGALFAGNAYHADFSGYVAFLDVDDGARTLTGDRCEFLGRNGSIGSPDAMTRTRLSGRLGAGLDPCGAIQVPFELVDGQEREIIFRLGAGRDVGHARELAQRMRTVGSARAALQNVRAYWSRTLGAVQVRTPDASLNVLSNGWLIYQTLACRLWARSGFYQSGGAFGFRDQLQDVMALIHTEPRLVREHLLRCAERQYPEGDVQHWWHPPYGQGVRTRCSDDYLWLPVAVCRYVGATCDADVLDERVPFLEGRRLDAGEESHYGLPGRSAETATLYEHCVRAILNGLRFGEHGLPLMGSGDWNDGMNRVGIHGRGESVWLGFFLYDVLVSFARLAQLRGDEAFADRCREAAETLRGNLEAHAWDGAWYRRAWFDDGSVLGSSASPECSIDSIAQSWSVLSGAGDPVRSREAMAAVGRRLVRRDAGVVQLLDPPFDRSALDPGYIRGYVPGVRENGGQYTHAAIWAAMAMARLGDGAAAWGLLDLINPANHALDSAGVALYKIEPYVVAADVYGVAPHTGRGGWSWYTGSAGWLYRLILESLLGLRREGDRLYLAPCLPMPWPFFEIDYRFGASLYRITVRVLRDTQAAKTTRIDATVRRPAVIQLLDDGDEHLVEVTVLSESDPEK